MRDKTTENTEITERARGSLRVLRGSILIVCIWFLSACMNESGANDRFALHSDVSSVQVFMPEKVQTIFKRSCESCHGFDGRGIAGIAPDLKRANPRSSGEWEKYLRNPQSAHPVSQMPPVWLDGDEIKTMAEFLTDLSSRIK